MKDAVTAKSTGAQEEYRKIISTASKLEPILDKLDTVIDLFTSPLVSSLFSKLCSNCLKLFIECDFKLEEFRKAEELVWRRIYHDVYRLLKTKRQLIKKQDEFLIESHFISGIGFYSSLIVQLRTRYKIFDNVQEVISPLNLALIPAEGLLEDVLDLKAKDAGNHWARQAIYRSLIYMGDLARYLIEFSDHNHRKLAFQLYMSAARYQPDHGLPFNQLATLAGNLNYNLDAICNYMRCCLRPKPFERAEGNLIKLFELNRKQHEEAHVLGVIKASDVLASKDPSEMAESLMKTAIVTFLKLTSDLWFAMDEKLSVDFLDSVVHDTQMFFEILREAMELEPLVPLATKSSLDNGFRPISGMTSDADRPRYVSPTIIYELCSISIMLIARRQQKSTEGSFPIISRLSDNITDLVNTLALNLLHYATSKCQTMIISKIQDIRLSRQEVTISRSMLSKLPPEMSNRSTDATSRRVMSRLRQKKAATFYTCEHIKSNCAISTQDADDSDLSELEETALSTIDALDISSDMSDGPDFKTDDLINLDSSSDDGRGLDNRMKISLSRTMMSRPSLRPTKSQTYETENKYNNSAHGSCSSLPMQDLMTGDLDVSFKTNPTIYRDVSNTPSEFGNESTSSPSLTESILSYIYNQTYLPTIKVLFDWLLSNRSIIDSNIESFSSFQIELQQTVELLEELKLLIGLNDGTSTIYGHIYCGPEWTQTYPLSCDLALVKLGPVQSVHESNIDFGHERELDDSESGFITIQCVMAFSHALSTLLQNKTVK